MQLFCVREVHHSGSDRVHLHNLRAKKRKN